MATHNLSVVLTGNATSLRGALLAAGREVKTFSNAVENSGKQGARAGSLLKTGFAAAAIAVGLAVGVMVSQAVAFDREMRNVQSITKESDASLGAMGRTLVNLSTELPQSAKTLAAGLYDIASSGFQGAAGLEVLEASAVAASAGLTTTAVSAKTITAVLNAYGLTADHATDVSDTLFQAVNLGVVTFEELAGTVGDVVGTAAAATVQIDEVSSAIATMTLSGIGASEAGTSLNRLLQSLIDPSDALAEALAGVGYESGAQALQVDTLSTVMEKLRIASGGNIETLLKWFPEIRAARGALALMAAEGENYRKTVAGIEVEENRAGATRAALNEQLKAVSAQWQLFINRMNAVAITGGTKLLPILLALMSGVTDLARAGVPPLQAALKHLAPFFESIAEVARDVWEIGSDLLDLLGPVAAALAGLVGGTVIVSLNALAEALSVITGLMVDHPAIVQAVALVYGSVLATSLLTSAGAMAGATKAWILLKATMAGDFLAGVLMRVILFGQGLNALVGYGASATTAMSKFKLAFSGLGRAMAVGGALVAVTLAVQEFSEQMGNAREQAENWAAEFTSGFDPARASLGDLRAEIDKNVEAAKQWQEAALNAVNPFKKESSAKARDELIAINQPMIDLVKTAEELQAAMDITGEEALNLARDQDFMAQATDPATGALDEEAAAALGAMEALSELSDQLKSMYDPLFAVQDATWKLKDAQQAVADAVAANKDNIEDNNVSQEEMIRLNEAAVRAAVDYKSSLVDLKAAIANGDVQVNTAIATLQSWVEQGVITQEQADEAAESFRDLAADADELNGKKVIVNVSADTTAGRAAIAAFKALMETIPRTVQSTFYGDVVIRPNRMDHQRYGGVYSYAGGGVTPAHIGRGDLIKYAEPETGGEAFVPRRGDMGRSTSVLREAAGWYGYDLIKMARGGILSGYGPSSAGAGGAPPVRIVLDANGADRRLLNLLRHMIRVEGGGNVQIALGQGAG